MFALVRIRWQMPKHVRSTFESRGPKFIALKMALPPTSPAQSRPPSAMVKALISGAATNVQGYFIVFLIFPYGLVGVGAVWLGSVPFGWGKCISRPAYGINCRNLVCEVV